MENPIIPGDPRIDHQHLLSRVAWLEWWLGYEEPEDDDEPVFCVATPSG